MARRQIYIHAGAHRTGTSSFQMCLHLNRSVLGAAGFDLGYPGRDGIPSGDLGLRLPAPRHGQDAAARFAIKVRSEIDRLNPDPANELILSEENIPGRMLHFQHGQFYPAAEARFDALRDGIGDADIKCLTFVVRDYAQLFVSAHRKRAEDRAVGEFADVVPKLLDMDRGWFDVLQIMVNTLKPRRFVVIDYASRGRSIDLLQHLVPGLGNISLNEPQRKANFSATDAGLMALQTRYLAGEKLQRSQWQTIIEAHAEDRTDHGFAKFAKPEVDILHARYQRDLERLKTMEDVEFIG